MNSETIRAALKEIAETEDPLEKALKLSGLVSTLFREREWEMVVVGGSAIEFYTEGQYMSGDIDMCSMRLERSRLRRHSTPRDSETAEPFVSSCNTAEANNS